MSATFLSVDVIKYLRDNKILTVLIENDDKNIIGITQLYDLIK